MQIDENVWNVVRNVAGSRNGGDIDAIENPIRIFAENRLAHDPVLPGDELTISIWADGGTAFFRTTSDGVPVLDRGRLTFRD